ncbi:MAG: Asp-tRNA(Asn)/Glu-tRNA(Gln) amidotransferase subunit GatC [Gemmatimonadota bacterium]
MIIGAAEVRHVARLAELAVAESEVATLAAQLEAIVAFVAQLNAVEVPTGTGVTVVGPERLALRDDRVDPIPMTRGPAEMAPEFREGFFVVPKLGGLADA